MDRRGTGINNHHEILKPLKGWKLRLAWAQRSPQPSTRLFLHLSARAFVALIRPRATIRELYYQVAENLAPIERRRGDHYVSQQSPTRVERRVHMQFLLRIPLAQTGKRRSCL